MPGTREEFDRSLEAIEAKVIELFAMITDDLPRAAHALEGDSGEAARVLAERERVIDALYLEVENLAGREVLLQAPVAADLRFLLPVLRVTPELERSHDLVMQVAEQAGVAAPAGGPHTPRPRARDADGRPRRRDVAAGSRRLVPARPQRGSALAGHPGDERTARRIGRRTCLWPGDDFIGDGDDPGRALLPATGSASPFTSCGGSRSRSSCSGGIGFLVRVGEGTSRSRWYRW